MHPEAQRLIDALGLIAHPEGGYYRESYRSTENVETESGQKCASTAIYFLLNKGQVSRLHRIQADEVWHHYAGGELVVHVVSPMGEYSALKLGTDLAQGQLPQGVVMAGDWFGAELAHDAPFALVGCTVAPGFEFKDLEFASRHTLTAICPQAKEIIARLTPQFDP